MSALLRAAKGPSSVNPQLLNQGRTGNVATLLCAMLLCSLFAAAAHSQAAATPQHPAKQMDNLTRAQTLLHQGQLGAAKANLLAILKRHPSSAEGYNLLGIVETQQNDYAGALASFQHALRLAPRSATTHINLGNLFLAQKKPELAEQQFQTALRLDPASRDGNFNLGLLLMSQRQPAKAIFYFEHVHPRDATTDLNLIRAYLGANRKAEALRLAASLSAAHPKDVKLHFSLGILLASAGQYKPASLELEKADALTPEQFGILYSLGQTYLLGGNYQKAELELSQALAKKPNSADTLYLIGKTYWKESRPIDALDSLVRAHALAPKNTDIILLMAQVSIAEGYYEDAIPLLQKGIAIEPHNADLLSALGEAYFRSENINKSLAAFQQVIAIQPSARAYGFLGLLHASIGRFDQARQDFTNGLKLDPGNSFCLFNLGYIAQQQGDNATAINTYEKVLRGDPNFPNALLQLATLRMQSRQFPAAEQLLKRYVRVARHPVTGYYKLAMVERELDEPEASRRDLARFQSLSKNVPPKAFAYEDLFDYLENRSKLSAHARNHQDLSDLQEQLKKHPNQPEVLYLLARTYLRTGQIDNARATIAQLNKVKAGDYRTLTGIGVLLARFHLYDDAISQFQSALRLKPDSDDVKFDLANAYFRKGQYSGALSTAQQISAQGHDEAYLALNADIEAHLGDVNHAEQMYRSAIAQSPDTDQNYLSLALLELRQGDLESARQTLLQGQARVPASGLVLWGLGVTSVLRGQTAEAGTQFERALDLLPQWPGSYSMLGVYYFETGQITKAREVLNRFSNSSAHGVLNIQRIEQVLEEAPANTPRNTGPLPMSMRENLLRLALALADKTL